MIAKEKQPQVSDQLAVIISVKTEFNYMSWLISGFKRHHHNMSVLLENHSFCINENLFHRSYLQMQTNIEIVKNGYW